MTNDLVKRLRCYADAKTAIYHPWIYGQAAYRIEELEHQVAEFEARIELFEDEIQDLKYEMRELGERS